MTVLGIDIGGTKTGIGLVQGNQVIAQESWPTPTHGGAEAVRNAIEAKAVQWLGRFDACGIAFGGPFDFRKQICRTSMHVTGWNDFPLTDWAKEVFKVPVVTDNDANVAAVGEVSCHPDLAEDLVFYATVSTGIGSAIVDSSKVLRGSHSLAGELGHIPIGHDRVCTCGQAGCLERAISGYWIQQDLGVDAATYLTDADNLAAWLEVLAQGLWTATLLIDPAVVIIGGGFANLGEPLRSGLAHRLDSFAQRSGRPGPQIRLGDPTGRSCLLGTAKLVEEVFT